MLGEMNPKFFIANEVAFFLADNSIGMISAKTVEASKHKETINMISRLSSGMKYGTVSCAYNPCSYLANIHRNRRQYWLLLYEAVGRIK